MTADIIEFTTRHRTPGAANDEPRKAAGTLTTTAKNERLRSARREAWRKAEATTRYWRALLDFTDAVSLAKRHGLKEARALVETSHEARWPILNSYREALGKHLLTPAPDVATVNWKRSQLSKTYVGVEKELVEKAIADDIAFLDAHPTRNSPREQAARRREPLVARHQAARFTPGGPISTNKKEASRFVLRLAYKFAWVAFRMRWQAR